MLETAQTAQIAQSLSLFQTAEMLEEIKRFRSMLQVQLEEARAAAERAQLVVQAVEKRIVDFSSMFPVLGAAEPAPTVEPAPTPTPVSVPVLAPAPTPTVSARAETTSSGSIAAVTESPVPSVAGKAVVAGPANRRIVQPRGAVGRVVIQAPVKLASGSSKTVPERLASAMGRHVWNAGDVLGELEKLGDKMQVNKPRNYISTTLSTALMNVHGADGKALRGPDGGLLKVHMFTAVERGQYRVSTAEDIQKEVRKILGASEVVFSDRHDEVFEDQGIERRYELVAAQH